MIAANHSSEETSPKIPPSARSTISYQSLLIRYFYSGWAFLIPYLGFYLLYYCRKWPANAFAPSALGNGGHIPALLHIYWALHLIHLGLIALALHNWWWHPQETDPENIRQKTPISAKITPDLSRALETAEALTPWFLLALLFYIPGVYLEWPSDPWEHFRRITEWTTQDVVGHHSAGYKSLYFFAYSFVGQISPIHQLICLNFYYTGMCILLAWQYFLLAMAVGFDRRWAFLSVVINVFTFGNVCFSFYRYYGLASTIFAQIGVIAVTRLALKTSTTCHFSLLRPVSIFFRQLNTEGKRTLLFSSFSLILLLLLVAFNHIQGLGVGGLCVMSIILWKTVDQRSSLLIWFLILAALLSILTIYWYPRSAAIDDLYRPTGWLTHRYGFNFYAWPSPAADRALQILGILGSVNLLVGILLIKENNIIGWLTLGPVVALSLPCIAIPLASRLSAEETGNIITFHRMFFAIPPGLAITELSRRYCTGAFLVNRSSRSSTKGTRGKTRKLMLLILGLCIIFITPTNRLYFNRAWNVFSTTPDDLSMKNIWRDDFELHFIPKSKFVAAAELSFIESMQSSVSAVCYGRLEIHAFSDLGLLRSAISKNAGARTDFVSYLKFNALYTPYSFAALSSMHWGPQACATIGTGATELRETSLNSGFRQSTSTGTSLIKLQRP